MVIWAITEIRVYLILRFHSNRENLTIAKYTCFTVLLEIYDGKLQCDSTDGATYAAQETARMKIAN